MGPEKRSGREFPHGQTALSVPSDNQKTVSRFDPKDESERSDGERGRSARRHSRSSSLAGPRKTLYTHISTESSRHEISKSTVIFLLEDVGQQLGKVKVSRFLAGATECDIAENFFFN